MANLPQRKSQSPFHELSRMQRDIDRMFENFLTPFGAEERWPGALEAETFLPACEVTEKQDQYLLSFDLPGIKKDDIHIELKDNQLVVSGERKSEHEEKSKHRVRSERTYGSFMRSFTMPSGLKPEQIKADYKDGVLLVSIPKVQGAQSSRIQIGEGVTPKKAA